MGNFWLLRIKLLTFALTRELLMAFCAVKILKKKLRLFKGKSSGLLKVIFC